MATPTQQRHYIWDAAREFKARIDATIPDSEGRTAAHVYADWAAVRAVARITIDNRECS